MNAAFCDLYHWDITGDIAVTLTANTCLSANHSGPSMLIMLDNEMDTNHKRQLPQNNTVISLEGNGARPSHLGKGYSSDGTMYTLNTIEQHSVCYSVDCRNNVLNEELNNTLQAKDQGGWSVNVTSPVLIVSAESDKKYENPQSIAYAIESHPMDSRVTMSEDGIVQTLNHRMGTGGGNVPFVLMKKHI